MTKIFKGTRQKMLKENRFSKYFLYAIGEIILVVVGILIALQINNYSEHKKERKQERILLSNLSDEIQLDILQIENNTTLSKERLSRLDSLTRLLATPDQLNKLDFLKRSYQFVLDQYFQSNSGIFDEAVSSGKMSLILNDELRQNIFDYYRQAKDSYTDGTTRQITDEVITPLMVESLWLNQDAFSIVALDVKDISNLNDFDINSLADNKDFWKMVLLKFGSNKEQMIRWNIIKQSAQEVKNEIDKELGKQ